MWNIPSGVFSCYNFPQITISLFQLNLSHCSLTAHVTFNLNLFCFDIHMSHHLLLPPFYISPHTEINSNERKNLFILMPSPPIPTQGGGHLN